MNIEAEIRNYISSKEHNGALLVTGKWGCGKTFTLKRVRDSYNEKGDAVIAMVSLFGIDSTELLAKKVKETVFFAQTSKTKEKSQRTIRRLKQNITTALSAFQEYSNIIKGVNAALSINFYDWVSVEKEVVQYSKDLKKNDPIKLPLVLIFDDLERCSIDIQDLLGSINDYVENRGIKTIIVADEDKINDKKYTEFKEKVICRTIKLSPDFSKIVDSIISSYKESEPGYEQFLTDNKEIIVSVFKESGFQNLRTVKSIMIDFERVYRACESSKITMKNIQFILYQFCVIISEHKNRNYIKSEENTFELKASESFNANNTDIFSVDAEDAIKKKYNIRAFDDIPISLSKWVVEGEWDEALFVAELQKLYGESKQTFGEQFLSQYFWSLDQKIIEEGIPETLEKAYNGELCCDDLLEFFKRVHSLKKFGAELPCVIDYHRIEKAFDERMKNIRNGNIQEPIKHTFAFDEDIDAQASPLKNKIEQLSDKTQIWDNYKKFTSYLNGNDQNSTYGFSFIDVFDDKLLQLFIQKYKKSENFQKRECGRTLIRISIYGDEEDIKISITNYELLQEWLKEIANDEKDQMARIITNEFIKCLKEKIEAITTQLHPHEPQEAL